MAKTGTTTNQLARLREKPGDRQNRPPKSMFHGGHGGQLALRV
jgi:hypothetical protein